MKVPYMNLGQQPAGTVVEVIMQGGEAFVEVLDDQNLGLLTSGQVHTYFGGPISGTFQCTLPTTGIWYVLGIATAGPTQAQIFTTAPTPNSAPLPWTQDAQPIELQNGEVPDGTATAVDKPQAPAGPEHPGDVADVPPVEDPPTPSPTPVPPAEPTILGPANPTNPGVERRDADLYSTIPNTDLMIGGDPRIFGGYPEINGVKNPLIVPEGTRPIVTGTAKGKDGKQYAFYSIPPYDKAKIVPPNQPYVTPNAIVVDLANRKKSVGNLLGIAQPSGAYDKDSNTMLIAGNTGTAEGDLERKLWQSAPLDPNHPDDWINTLAPVGNLIEGDRESQLVALEGGGFLFVSSTNDGAIRAATANTPLALTQAPWSTIIPATDLPTVYGPTVKKLSFNPDTKLEETEIRVSTWVVPPGWTPPKDKPEAEPPYNPETHITRFTIQH